MLYPGSNNARAVWIGFCMQDWNKQHHLNGCLFVDIAKKIVRCTPL